MANERNWRSQILLIVEQQFQREFEEDDDIVGVQGAVEMLAWSIRTNHPELDVIDESTIAILELSTTVGLSQRAVAAAEELILVSGNSTYGQFGQVLILRAEKARRLLYKYIWEWLNVGP